MSEMQSGSIGDLAVALARAQGKIRGAKMDAQNPHLHNKYADLASCWEACREPLSAEGLAVIQLPVVIGGDPDGNPIMELETTLAHGSGQWIKSRVPVIFNREEKGLKPMQCLGSALTYARRYGLAAMVGIAPEEDDGEGAGHSDRGQGRPASSGNGRGNDGPPTSGPRLFARLKEMQENSGGKDKLLDGANAWGKTHGMPDRIVDWPSNAVADFWVALQAKFAAREAKAATPAEEREPGSNG